MFDVKPSLIRFWEQKFDVLKPDKNRKGNRLFSPKDVENLKLIYHLVKENGMTLSGAAKRLRDNKEGASRDLEIIEKLQSVRSLLLEVREELKSHDGDREVFVDSSLPDEVSATDSQRGSYDEAVVEPETGKVTPEVESLSTLHPKTSHTTCKSATKEGRRVARPQNGSGEPSDAPVEYRPAEATVSQEATLHGEMSPVESEGPALPRFLQREIPIPQPSEVKPDSTLVPQEMPTETEAPKPAAPAVIEQSLF